MTTLAKWPESEHIPPIPLPVDTSINGSRMRHETRILSEDEYQLLLAGFKAAGGKVRDQQS